MNSFWRFLRHVTRLDETRQSFPLTALPLMAIFIGQGSACGVRTVFANKRTYAFDMCFKLIGLSAHVSVVKQNDCDPVAVVSPGPILVFGNPSQVFLLKKKNKKKQNTSLQFWPRLADPAGFSPRLL